MLFLCLCLSLLKLRQLQRTIKTEHLSHAYENQLLKDIFNYSPDGLVFRDMSGKAILYNEALIREWDPIDREEFLKAPKEKWLRYPNNESFIDAGTSPTARALKGEAVISEELMVTRPSLPDRRILVTAIPVFRDGKQYGAFAITRDVANFTRKLEFRSQRNRLNALGTLAGGIAHDFNNQLATIMGSAQVAKTELNRTDRISEYLDTIVSVCKSGSQLTRQLMSLGQIRSGDLINLNIQTFLKDFRPMIDSVFDTGVTIDVSTDDAVMPVNCDPVQLESALLNLIMNAKNAMATTSTRKLSIMATNYRASPDDPGALQSDVDYVRISVRDNGVGMSEEIMRRAIDPFFSTKSDDSEGFGLGLTTVDGFVRQCGGAINIDSVDGDFTQVDLFLPAATTIAVIDRASNVVVTKKGKGETVLLVEDRAELRQTLGQMLKGLNYRVITADAGQQALEKFKDHQQIDIAVVDVVLPGTMGGVRLTSEIRKIAPNTKVILMSGFFDDGGQVSIDPNQSFLQKPVSREKLASEIANVLNPVWQ